MAVAATALVGVFSVAIAATLQWTGEPKEPLVENVVALVEEHRPADARPADASNVAEPVALTRPVYRHSIVPGGVYTAPELAAAVARDPVVAAHYAGLDASVVRVERLRQPFAAHVSYRVDDSIYWTKRKLQLAAGEQILTDGKTTVRARCGNVVSMMPRAPLFAGEPIETEFEMLSEPIVLASLPPLKTPLLPKRPPTAPPRRLRSAAVEVPQPGTLLLLGFGVAALLARHLYRRGTKR